MPHNMFHAGCTVYVWDKTYLGFGRVGHAAIKVSDGKSGYIYLSYWPNHSPAGYGPNALAHAKEQIKANQSIFSKNPLGDGMIDTLAGSYVENTDNDGDKKHEGTKASYKCKILAGAGLDWEAMLKLARRWKNQTDKYDLRKNNCSHAVANVLSAGNPPEKVPLEGTFTNTWTPGYVKSYCNKLVQAINKQTENMASEQIGGG